MKKWFAIITLTFILVFTGVSGDVDITEATSTCCETDGGGTPPINPVD